MLGKVYLKQEKLEEAEKALLKCIELSRDNILAHQLLGDTYLAMKSPLEALKAYKMTLFLNPFSAKAKKAVEKLESASALEFEEDTFAMAKLSDLKQIQKNQPLDESPGSRSLKPILQLVDAFLIRGDHQQAAELLKESTNEFGSHPELENRLKKLTSLTSIERLRAKAPGNPLSSPPPVVAPLAPQAPLGKVAAPISPPASPQAPSHRPQIREAQLQRLYGWLRQVRIAKSLNANLSLFF
jgi:tetratricopeptide (TPR) repeat protein